MTIAVEVPLSKLEKQAMTQLKQYLSVKNRQNEEKLIEEHIPIELSPTNINQ